jgi:hypothetical protein
VILVVKLANLNAIQLNLLDLTMMDATVKVILIASQITAI